VAEAQVGGINPHVSLNVPSARLIDNAPAISLFNAAYSLPRAA
jgi:hypothetical protein